LLKHKFQSFNGLRFTYNKNPGSLQNRQSHTSCSAQDAGTLLLRKTIVYELVMQFGLPIDGFFVESTELLRILIHSTTMVNKSTIYSRYSQSTCTSDDVNKLVGNSGLTTTIVLHLQSGDHIACILGCIVHCVAAITLFACVAFNESSKDCVSQ